MQKKEQARKNIRTCSLARCKGEALKSNFRPEMYESERNGCHQRDALKTVPRTVFLTGFRIPCSKNAKKRTSPEKYPNLFFGALQGIRTPDLLVRSFRLILLLNLIMNYQALRNLAKSRLFQIVLQISLKEQCDSKSKMLEKC